MESTLTPTQYLYGSNPEVFTKMTYIDALRFKASLAKELLHQLLDVSLEDRDIARIMEVYQAVEFNKELLEEVGETVT